MKSALLYSAILFLFTSASSAVWAQGRVIGRVVDERGEPVGGATVSLVGKTVPHTQAAISNGQGYYVLLGVQEGGYEVRVKRRGYPEWRAEIAVAASTTKRMDVRLGEAPEIVVKANPASADKDRDKGKQQEAETQYNIARDIEVSAISNDAGMLSALKAAEEFAKVEESVTIPDK
ncbi:MAG: carboxypeptidase-like regulatory domain-containing protein, partial [Chloroherpetonaceae bacterium]|nr:carboxypeptidase-like regulatory domain-containing protein [Chloroherpetonaceae bacterium]